MAVSGCRDLLIQLSRRRYDKYFSEQTDQSGRYRLATGSGGIVTRRTPKMLAFLAGSRPFRRRTRPETRNCTQTLSAKLHYTDTGYTDMLYNTITTILQLTVQQICHIGMRNARAQHLDMSRCWNVAIFCPFVVNLLYNRL